MLSGLVGGVEPPDCLWDQPVFYFGLQEYEKEFLGFSFPVLFSCLMSVCMMLLPVQAYR